MSAIHRFITAMYIKALLLPERLREDKGQTVAEYALVLLVAAAVATAFLIWAKQSGKLDQFFDAIFQKLLGSVDPSPTPAP
ncbi:MAG TPA: hypothetical protein VNE62_12105 [Actinomycetota bacterium]|nr:hypothetical protein [Actinomycetota bacterium]